MAAQTETKPKDAGEAAQVDTAPTPSDEQEHRDESATAAAGQHDETRSPLSLDTTLALIDQLDRARVKSRGGRGGGSFDYLETHDVIRTANRIFGFGNWGHEIVEQERIAEVEVQSSGTPPRKGWHVAYRCVVRVTVSGCVPMSGSGYGDGVEYGPAAQATASELALKEAESDALKRALKNYGDQFGLILYAKGDDQARIERDQAADQAQAVRVESPMSLPDALTAIGGYVLDAKPWVREAVEKLWPDVEFTAPKVLNDEQKYDLLRRLMTVTATLDGQEFLPNDDAEETQRRVRIAFAAAFEGYEILGPDPFELPIPF